MLVSFILIFSCHFDAMCYGKEIVNREALVNCMLKGEELFASPSKTIVISLPISEQDAEDAIQSVSKTLLAQGLTRYKSWPLMIVNTKERNIVIPKAYRAHTIQNYILYFRRRGELQISLKELAKSKVLNPHARYLVVSPTFFKDDIPVITEVFEVLHIYQILNAVLLLADPKANITFNIFSLRPFNNNDCSYKITEDVKRIDTCSNGQYQNGTYWYDSKVPKMFRSCQLRVMYVDLPPYVVNMKNNTILSKEEYTKHGRDVGVLTNLFSRINVSLLFIKSHELGKAFLNNSTATGSLYRLLTREAELAIGGYAQTYERFSLFDLSFPYSFQSLVWVVPHEHIHSAVIISITQIVQDNVWYLIILLTVSSTALIVMSARYDAEEHSSYKKLIDTFQKIMLAMNSASVSPKPKSNGVRLIFSMILIFAVMFNATYTTYLTSVLAKEDKFKEKYRTVEDILNYNLNVYITENSQIYFQEKDSVEQQLIQKSLTCPYKFLHKCLEEVVLYKNVSLLVQDGYIKYQVNHFMTPSNSHLIKYLRNEVVSYPLYFIMLKGFWGYDRINTLLSQALDCGLAQKWMKAPHLPRTTIGSQTNTFQIVENTLELRNLRSVVLLFLFGYTCATVVFILEIAMFKYK